MPRSASSPAPRVPGPAALAAGWIGGGLFVASLLFFLYRYEVTWAQPASAESRPIQAAATNFVLFTIFALHHSVLARSGAKQQIVRIVPSWAERSLYVWIASVLFLATCAFWQPVDGVVYAVPAPFRFVGYLVQAAGLYLTVAGSGALDVLDLAGIRQIEGARRATPPPHVALVTRGVYGLVRHPLYLGWALFVFGTPTLTGTRALFAVVSTLYLVLAIRFEERNLAETFGADYERYQRAVPWRMLSGIW